jgi:archaellum component FlaC
MSFVSEFGGKSAGQLIRAEDWNNLAAALDELESGLTTKITDLATATDNHFSEVDADIAALKGTVDELGGTVSELKTAVDGFQALVGQFFRVNLTTTRSAYASGEVAEIVAEVRDLHGNPITFTNANRPWVDFVSVWGHLVPSTGFESQAGDSSGGERAISVRTNTSGVARVQLRAEVAKDLPPEIHLDMAATLTTKLSNNLTIADAILGSSTPQQAKSSGAFTAIAQEYDRPTAVNVRSYVDKYYVDNSVKIVGKIVPPIFNQRWRDYHSTVLAFAKADADPLTPDSSRGGSSIQVTFRDWIGPWVDIHYLDPVEIKKDLPDIRTKLQQKFTPDYLDSVKRLKEEIVTLVPDDGGLVGKLRGYQTVHDALDGVSTPHSAELVAKVTQTVQQAVVMPQTFEPAQATTFAKSGQVALNALTDSTVQSAAEVSGVKSTLATVQTQVADVSNKVSDAHTTIAALDTKVTQTSSKVDSVNTSVSDVRQKVNKVQDLYPDTVANQFLALKGAVLDVNAIKAHLNLP